MGIIQCIAEYVKIPNIGVFLENVLMPQASVAVFCCKIFYSGQCRVLLQCEMIAKLLSIPLHKCGIHNNHPFLWQLFNMVCCNAEYLMNEFILETTMVLSTSLWWQHQSQAMVKMYSPDQAFVTFCTDIWHFHHFAAV